MIDYNSNAAPSTTSSFSVFSQFSVVDLVNAGYFKLLGNGQISAPVIVKAKYVSKIAEKKIVAAGGAVVLIA